MNSLAAFRARLKLVLRDVTPAYKATGGNVSISNSSSSALAATGMQITCPTKSGKTYTVVFHLPHFSIANATNQISVTLSGSVLGDGAQMAQGSYQTAGEGSHGWTISRGGFSPGEVATVKWLSNQNTNLVYFAGGWSAFAYEEA
jgi:hypothetical protein